MSQRLQTVQFAYGMGRPAPTERPQDARYRLSQDALRAFRETRSLFTALGLDVEREIRALEIQAEQAIVAIR